ncbi:aldo/keto reductase [Halosquirtibacter xylanolyticus]|uniref:aldo/keto reductase n=1 Tax=Halosquirtibacter xylanolyticus TaxID=3374599 RepID=UPI003749B55A|nr:aldo/keto reductase [Prolixibacteraceae bacterium]
MIPKSYNKNGIELSRLGLGCMRLSMTMTGASVDKNESIKTIHRALDLGINLLNTGDFYADGENEKLIAESLKGVDRDKAFISLKYGTFSNMMTGGPIDVGPKNVKKYLTDSLRRLNVDYVDLYQPARIDVGIPLEETIGAISDLVDAGYVKHIGLSEVDAATLRKAHEVHPISLVESVYSIIDNTVEAEVLPTARELGIGVVAFGLMGLGKLSKQENDPLMHTMKEIINEKEITLSQLAHAWILSKGEDIIPLVGARNISQLDDSVKSVAVDLKKDDILRLEDAIAKSQLVGPSMPKLVIRNGILER